MHLREPELRGDPPLAEAAEEAQLNDAALAPGECPQASLEQQALLAELEPAFGCGIADHVRRGVQRHRPHGAEPTLRTGNPERLCAVAKVTPDLADDRSEPHMPSAT